MRRKREARGRCRPPDLLALALAAALVPGCLKQQMKVTVYPDGSGKLEMTVGLKNLLGEDPGFEKEEEKDGEESFLNLFLEGAYSEVIDGIAGWGEPEEWEKGGFKFTRLTGYFEDINKLRIGVHEDEDWKGASFAFRKAEDGSFVLEYVDKNTADSFRDSPELSDFLREGISKEQKEKSQAIAKLILKDYETQCSFRMPGRILKAEGMETKDRDATVSWDIDDIFELVEKPEALEEGFRFVITSGPEADLSEEMAAFRKEMEKVAPKKRGRLF